MAQAKTDTMDTLKTLQPILVEKPARRREMKTQEFVGEDESEEGARRTTEKFHEGYVEGKLYLVPDSNLEAMADMINLKMRRMESSKYLNEAEALKENDLEDIYSKRRHSMFKKLDRLTDSKDDGEIEEGDEEEEEDEEDEEEEGKKAADEDLLEELTSSSSEEAEDEEKEKGGESDVVKEQSGDEKEEREEDRETMDKEGVDAEGSLMPVYFHDPNVRRFLISGHFWSNRKPIFIVQQYEGPSVFKHKAAQFFSQKSEKDVDIFISGEFFKESILEEDEEKKPISLNTKPHRVVIDRRCRIYDDKFTEVIVGCEVDVVLSGSFIKHSLEALHTPLLSIALRKGTANAPRIPVEAGRVVYLMRPIADNLFENEKRKGTRRKRKDDRRKLRDFEEHSGRIEGFEYPKGSKVSGPMTVYVSHPEIEIPWPGRSTRYENSSRTKTSKRDAFRDTLWLPETSGGSSPRGILEIKQPRVDLRTSSARKEHIRRILTGQDSQSGIPQEFVKPEREKFKERRRKERK